MVVKNIVKYLRKIKDLFLIFREGSELLVEGYTNLDFMSNIDDRNSTSGCIFFCNDGSTSWKNSKQQIITDSTIKAEYIAASKVAKDAFWYKNFLVKLGIMPLDTITLYYDTNSTIALIKELRSYQKASTYSGNIVHDYLKKNMEVKRVNSTNNVANPLTKPLS